MEYYKRLDSVRGLAAILVVISHWTQSHYGRDFVYLGTVGVITFFVLSGFLITRILLSAKESNLSSEKKHWVTLKNFAIRRVLRIFPIYYLVILVGFTFSDYFRIKMDEGFWYFMTYTSNFHYYQLGGLQGRLAATWTLAIEEQFYLFFPWFVLFLRKNWTKYFLWFLFMVGVLFLAQYLKYFLKIISMNEWAPYLKALPLLTPSAFDSLGAGALLAYFTVYSKNKVKQYFHVLSLLGLARLILFLSMKKGFF